MMYRSLLSSVCIALVFCLTLHDASGQGFAFGLKGGPTLGLQRWNNFQGNDPLLAQHVVAFIESYDETSTGSLFAEAGYHTKGRTIRFRSSINPNTGITYEAQTFKLKFNNASLSLGARNRFFVGTTQAFYSVAIRGEYNISADLELYQGYSEGIQKFVYGLSLGGGFEFPFGEFVGGIIDIRFSPDISRQIFLPASRFNNPFTGTQEVFREQSVKNVALEVSLGLRFLRKIIYID
jgi:hypothetical protein